MKKFQISKNRENFRRAFKTRFLAYTRKMKVYFFDKCHLENQKNQ